MKKVSEKVSVRINPRTLDALEHLVQTGKYPTVSDAIREAIENLIETHFAPENIRKFMIELPAGNVIELEKLVRNGDAISIHDAIRNAVREYVRERLPKLVGREHREGKGTD
jgi:CopG family nickel-responsive transcriptional regulator